MFWLGFEVAGWACVITCSVFAQTIWWQARSLFEGYLLGRQIGRPLDMGRFVLFVGGLHLSISFAIALLVGFLACSAWRRRGGGGISTWKRRSAQAHSEATLIGRLQSTPHNQVR